MMRSYRLSATERGQVLPLVALLLVAILTMVAIVVDLGHLRETHRSNSRIADLAALAAGPELAKDNAVGACSTAFNYIAKNTPDLPSAAAADCAGLPSACTASTSPTNAAITNASPYTIVIRYPVSRSDIADANLPGGIGEQDGTQCQRLLVTMTRTNSAFFGAVVGSRTLSTHATAVVRAVLGRPTVTPTLWLLDPFGCGNGGAGALAVVGGSAVSVGQRAPPIAGNITLDSDGTQCSGGQTTISNSPGASISAIPSGSGTIRLFAMPTGATACAPNAAHDCPSSSTGMSPYPPIPSQGRATRAPIDWKYNCKIGYPAFVGAVAVDDCPSAGTVPPYIDGLVGAVGSTGAPPGYGDYVATFGPRACSPSGTVTIPLGNWWVSCPNFKVSGGAVVAFAGGNVVFDGNIDVPSGSLAFNSLANTGTLSSGCAQATWDPSSCISSSSSSAAFVFMRSGNISVSGTGVSFNNTFVYQAPGSTVSVTGGASPNWSAPTAGPFANLSLWSEGDTTTTATTNPATTNKLSGSGGWNIPDGIFFAPLSRFDLSGTSGLRQTGAQFIAYDMSIGGGATFNLTPPTAALAAEFQPRYQLIR